MSKITTMKELMNSIGVKNLKDVESEEKQKKLFDVFKNNNISHELFLEVLSAAPMILTSFNEMLKSISNIGQSIEETKRIRWEVLQVLASENKLTGEQILEAMNIIQEIEKDESIDWDSIFKTFVKSVTVIGAICLGILAAQNKDSMSDA